MALGSAPPNTKVVVFGGNGFAGSRVCKILVGTGAKVVSISRSGSTPEWATGMSIINWFMCLFLNQWRLIFLGREKSSGEDWLESVDWKKGDPSAEDMSGLLSGSAAVVSCVGSIGGSDSSMEAGNGAVNVAIAQQVQERL